MTKLTPDIITDKREECCCEELKLRGSLLFEKNWKFLTPSVYHGEISFFVRPELPAREDRRFFSCTIFCRCSKKTAAYSCVIFLLAFKWFGGPWQKRAQRMNNVSTVFHFGYRVM